MEGKLQTSFIPKKTFVPTPSLKPVRHTSIITLVMGILLVTVIALAVAVFVYTIYLNHRIDGYKTDLTTAMTKLDPSTVSQLSRTDNRIESAKSLLGSHSAPSQIFTFLQNNTLTNVRFSDFSYTTTNNKLTITMNGQARGFSDVALQAQSFGSVENKKYLTDPVFNNLNLDTSGNVTFTFTSDLDPQAFIYTP